MVREKGIRILNNIYRTKIVAFENQRGTFLRVSQDKIIKKKKKTFRIRCDNSDRYISGI